MLFPSTNFLVLISWHYKFSFNIFSLQVNYSMSYTMVINKKIYTLSNTSKMFYLSLEVFKVEER